MKKYLIASVILITLVLGYYLTRSWVLSFILLFSLIVYIAWVIQAELGFWNSKGRRQQIDEEFKATKEKHLKRTEDNPSLR